MTQFSFRWTCSSDTILSWFTNWHVLFILAHWHVQRSLYPLPSTVSHSSLLWTTPPTARQTQRHIRKQEDNKQHKRKRKQMRQWRWSKNNDWTFTRKVKLTHRRGLQCFGKRTLFYIKSERVFPANTKCKMKQNRRKFLAKLHIYCRNKIMQMNKWARSDR